MSVVNPALSAKIAGSIAGYLAEADIHSKRGDWSRASDSYSKVIKLDANNKQALIGRTKCYIALGQPDLAIKDVDKILAVDKFFYKGIFQKAEALFSAGAFEHALIYYHRGHKLRADLDDFRLGIQKCQEAIDLALSADRKPEANKRAAAQMSSTVPAPGKTVSSSLNNTIGAPNNSGRGDVSAMSFNDDTGGAGGLNDSARYNNRDRRAHVLGELSTDRKFLEDLAQDETLKSHNAAVSSIAVDGLKYLDTRTEFWRQQNPGGHDIRTDSRTQTRSGSRTARAGQGSRGPANERESISRGYQTERGAQGGAAAAAAKTPKTIAKQRYLENTRFAMQKLEAISQEMEREDWVSALKMQKTFLSRLNTMELADKGRILGTLYDQMGTTYFHMDKLNLAIIYFHKDLDIAIKEKFKDAFLRALGNLGNVYQRMGDTDQAATMWEKKLIALDTPDEEAELCESIARCYFTSQKYDLAIEFGERGIKSAQLRGDVPREMSTTFIVGHAHFNLVQYDKAITYYEKYLELARLQNDDLARADALSSLGNAYLQLGEVTKSVALQQEAILISSSLNQPYQQDPNKSGPRTTGGAQTQQPNASRPANNNNNNNNLNNTAGKPPQPPAERSSSRASSRGKAGGRPESRGSRPRSAHTRSSASPDLIEDDGDADFD